MLTGIIRFQGVNVVLFQLIIRYAKKIFEITIHINNFYKNGVSGRDNVSITHIIELLIIINM